VKAGGAWNFFLTDVDSRLPRSLFQCKTQKLKGIDPMKLNVLFATVLVAAAAFAADNAAGPSSNAAEAYSRLKSLVGEWQAESDSGKATVTYELIAGGTALVEREKAPDMPEMMTVFHLDGSRLTLTHYCMVGNQPRMVAQPFDPASKKLEFKFLDGANVMPTSGHMHNATFRFVDDKHLLAEWQFYENGQVKMTESMKYTRVR
jgi:hypothetical protein